MACSTGFKRKNNSEEKKLPIRKCQPKLITFYMNTVLLVDGLNSSRLTEQEMLASLGFHTLALSNAQDAIEILATGARFDFIVIDFHLSIINGPQMVRQIRAMGIPSKILGLCTNYNTDTRRMFYEAGADVCIGKPLTLESLREIIRYLGNVY